MVAVVLGGALALGSTVSPNVVFLKSALEKRDLNLSVGDADITLVLRLRQGSRKQPAHTGLFVKR